MASPDDPDATLDAQVDSAAQRPPLPVDRIELPVYRPRRTVSMVFWFAFVAAAVVTALVIWLVLA